MIKDKLGGGLEMHTQSKQNATWHLTMAKYFTVALFSYILSFVVFQTLAFAAPKCDALFLKEAKGQGKNDVSIFAGDGNGIDFLLKKDSKLHNSLAVAKVTQQNKRNLNIYSMKPAEKVSLWLNRLTDVSKKASSSPFAELKVKDVLYDQYVIKRNDIPEHYYDLQVRLARERGHGTLVLSHQQKIELAETLIVDQKRSLDNWIEYLISNETQMYPMWLKYWMFTGMTKLSKYDNITGLYGERNRETIAPFAELNSEALAYVADGVLKKVNKNSLESIADPEFVKLLDGTNFGKLYGRALFSLGTGRAGKFLTNEGKWKIYPQRSDHIPLVKSLEGKNTGWCTAGESTAKSQLSIGDFHVYYSLDAQGNATIPRVAIRMHGAEIAEVRGVGPNQNMDTQIHSSNLIASKMQEFGNKGDSFLKKDAHMKTLTQIENKHRLGLKLTRNDLNFIYEMDETIVGFGQREDPRIKEILKSRDKKDDLIVLFDKKYNRDEISLSNKEFVPGKSKVHFGDLDIKEFNLPNKFGLPEILHGNLKVQFSKSPTDLVLPKTLKGNLELDNLQLAKGLKFPDTVGNLILNSLTSTDGLALPKNVTGYLSLDALTSPEGLILPDKIGGMLSLSSLTTASGFKFPDVIDGRLRLNSLISDDGIVLPRIVTGSLLMQNLTSISSLKLPDEVGGLFLNRLTSAENLVLPKKCGGEIHLESLTSAQGLTFPQTTGNLYLNGLVSSEGLVLPTSVQWLYLDNLTSAEGLKLPITVNGYLFMTSLSSAKGLIKPKGLERYYGPIDLGK